MVTSIKGARSAASACVLFVLLCAVLAGCARDDPVATALARVTAEVGATGTARAQAAQATGTAEAAVAATREMEATEVAIAEGTATAQAQQEATQAAAATGTAAIEAAGTRAAAATQMAQASRATATAVAGATATAEGVSATAAAETTRAALLAVAETADRVFFTSPGGVLAPDEDDDLELYFTSANVRDFVAEVALTLENHSDQTHESHVSVWFRSMPGFSGGPSLNFIFLVPPDQKKGRLIEWSYTYGDAESVEVLARELITVRPMEDGAYHLRLIVQEETGLFTIDDVPVAVLDLSPRTAPGGIALAAYFAGQQGGGNGQLRYDAFVIRGWE